MSLVAVILLSQRPEPRQTSQICTGTAAELADRLNQILGGIPSLTDDAGAANERLVRHYVTKCFSL